MYEENVRKLLSKKTNIFLDVIGSCTAVATAMAEFLGASLGIYLLLGIPLKTSAIIDSGITYCLVFFKKYGQRAIEIIITIFVCIICIAYTIEIFLGKPDMVAVTLGTIMPQLRSKSAVLIGATVMPHVIYLHSELVQYRSLKFKNKSKRQLLNLEKLDIVLAMNIAFVVNAAMVIVSAAVFNKNS